MRDKILDFLKRKEGYISGDQISHRLGITRQALWKHIQELRDSGYDIVAVPHLGYRINSIPDRLFPSEVSYQLNTRFIGRKIYYFEALSSTMDVATQLGAKGEPSGTVVVAEAQTRGRGRLGREWFSPKHKGIYFSLLLKPHIPPNQASIFTLLAAVSVCEAIREVAGLTAQIKWPNDLLIHNKKLGGILTELEAETDQVRFVNIGIGLNVNNEKKSLPGGATSLREQKGQMLSRLTLLQEILRKIEANYLLFEKKGSPVIIEKWCDHNVTLGKRIKVAFQKEHIEGLALDIDTDGGLLVRADSGVTQKVMAGDIVHYK